MTTLRGHDPVGELGPRTTFISAQTSPGTDDLVAADVGCAVMVAGVWDATRGGYPVKKVTAGAVPIGILQRVESDGFVAVFVGPGYVNGIYASPDTIAIGDRIVGGTAAGNIKGSATVGIGNVVAVDTSTKEVLVKL